jgi:hypothetical protein
MIHFFKNIYLKTFLFFQVLCYIIYFLLLFKKKITTNQIFSLFNTKNSELYTILITLATITMTIWQMGLPNTTLVLWQLQILEG